MAKGSKGRHGGGHKARQRGAEASGKREADREAQKRIAEQRGLPDTSGRKGRHRKRGS